jgi:hypothetical protein
MSPKEFEKSVIDTLNQLTLCVAQMGQALSVWVPDADLDPCFKPLQRASKNIDELNRLLNE